jgi:hypothetical protein
MTETGVRESRDGVTQVEVMVEGKSHDDSNTGTPIVRGNRVNTSKSKVTGQKRKRHCFSDVHTTFLEVQLEKGNLDRPEGRQEVVHHFTKDTKDHVPVERIHKWFRNHKSKNSEGGRRRGGGWFLK